MKRRTFIAALGGAAAWLAAQAEQKRRVGVLTSGEETDTQWWAPRLGAFQKAIQELGWTPSNLQLDFRYGFDEDSLGKAAQELIALSDVIFASTPRAVLAVKKVSRTVPIVFAAVTDPIALGLVQVSGTPAETLLDFFPLIRLRSEMARIAQRDRT
jgi:putative ABC transport system substrate-binding protein